MKFTYLRFLAVFVPIECDEPSHLQFLHAKECISIKSAAIIITHLEYVASPRRLGQTANKIIIKDKTASTTLQLQPIKHLLIML